MLDAVLGEIEIPDAASVAWRDGIVALMDSSRRLLLAHPRLVSMVFARATLGPNAARLGEVTFALLRRGGLEGERAVEAFHALLTYTLGFAAMQAPRQGSDAERADRARTVFGTLPEDGFPEMRAVAEELSGPPTDANFRAGLNWLLDGAIASRDLRATSRRQSDERGSMR